MTNHRIAKFFVLAASIAAVPALSMAGNEMKESKEVKSVVEAATESWITGDLGVTVVSSYITRGILQENQGFIAQPYTDLYFKLYESEGFINKVSLNLGLWSSLHSEHTGAIPGSNTPAWYEFDYTVGLAVTFAKNFTATTSYFEFNYPNDAFGFTAQRNVNFNLAYDDSDLLGAFALRPHVAVLWNFNGITGLGEEDAFYYEFGIAPGFAAGPVTFTIPLNVGLGDENFYPGDAYGYFSAGLSASVPLSFIPEKWGSWTFSAGFTYYNLGSSTEAANANQDGNAYVGQGSIGLTF